jgi:hypothetical protein
MNSNTILTEQMDWILNIHNQSIIKNKFNKTPNILLLYNIKHTHK